jgi:hypothetical protein
MWPSDATLLSLGPLELRWSGALLGLGMGLGYLVVQWVAARWGIGPRALRDAALWSLPEAIFGARVAYALAHPEIYLLAPQRIAHVWDGGFAFGAGLAIGTLAAWRHARRQPLPFGRLADAAVPGLLLAEGLAALGRWLDAPRAIVGDQPLAQAAWALGALVLYVPLARRVGTPGLLFVGYLLLQALGQWARLILTGRTDLGALLGAAGWMTLALTALLIALYHLRRAKC